MRQLREQKKNLEAALLFGTQEDDLRKNVQVCVRRSHPLLSVPHLWGVPEQDHVQST